MIAWAILSALACGAAFAAEVVLLTSGADLRIERHEKVGERLRLHTASGGWIELPAHQVVSIEREPEPAPPTAPTAAAAPVREPLPSPRELVEDAAEDFGLPALLLHLVARAESGYRQDVVSRKGAIGIMQLMPETAAALNADPHDARQNVAAGARYLRSLLLKYQGYPDQLRRALAAYNAGPGAVARFGGVPPYAETQHYVQRIVEAYRKSLDQRPGRQ